MSGVRTMAEQVKVSPASRPLTCPYCSDSLAGGELASCSGCGACYHAACWWPAWSLRCLQDPRTLLLALSLLLPLAAAVHWLWWGRRALARDYTEG